MDGSRAAWCTGLLSWREVGVSAPSVGSSPDCPVLCCPWVCPAQLPGICGAGARHEAGSRSERPDSARGDKYLLAELFFHLAGLAL